MFYICFAAEQSATDAKQTPIHRTDPAPAKQNQSDLEVAPARRDGDA